MRTPPLTGHRALLLVAAVTVLAATGVAAVLATITERASSAGTTIVGHRETVRLTGPEGTTTEVIATIDTGAERTSIDEPLATRLGIDTEAGRTVTVRSALGEQRRRVVPVVVHVAGTATRLDVAVADRSGLPDRVLLGRDALGGVLVAPDQVQLTTPGSARPPSGLAALMTAGSEPFAPRSLLAMLPLAAAVIVVLRYVIGVATLGTFTPVLLTLGLLQVGLVPGTLLTVGVIAVGVALSPLLRRWRTPRVARLAVLIGAAASLLVLLDELGGVPGAAVGWGGAFPLVVAAGLIERIYEVLELDGVPAAVRDTAGTLTVAVGVVPLLLSPLVRYVTSAAPLAVTITSVGVALLAGSYRGLRLSELARFERAARPAGGAG